MARTIDRHKMVARLQSQAVTQSLPSATVATRTASYSVQLSTNDVSATNSSPRASPGRRTTARRMVFSSRSQAANTESAPWVKYRSIRPVSHCGNAQFDAVYRTKAVAFRQSELVSQPLRLHTRDDEPRY